jgi:hypothetical protein
MIRELIGLGFAAGELMQDLMPKMRVNDINYFIELHAANSPPPKPLPEPHLEVVSSFQEKRFEEHLERNEEFLSGRYQNELLKRELNQVGRRRRTAEKAVELVRREKPKLAHPCLKCG